MTTPSCLGLSSEAASPAGLGEVPTVEQAILEPSMGRRAGEGNPARAAWGPTTELRSLRVGFANTATDSKIHKFTDPKIHENTTGPTKRIEILSGFSGRKHCL